MANLGRSERQLMRQRGAGMRAAKEIDFGLNFGSQGSREDRQLMRQRGAGNRRIDQIDFGFAFPTPNNSRRSSSRLSKSDRRSTEPASRPSSARKERRSSAVTSAKTVPAGSRASIPARRSLSTTPQPVVQPEQPNSSKRRRLNKQAPIQISIDPVESPHSPGHSVSRNRTPDVAEANEAGEGVVDGSTSTPQNAAWPIRAISRQDSPLFFPETDDKENFDMANEDEPNQSNKKRPRPRREASIRSVQTPLLQVGHNSVVRSVEAEESGIASPVDQMNATTSLDALEAPDLDIREGAQTSTKAIKKRKKRKSVILVKKKRRSSEMRRESSLQVLDETAYLDQSMSPNLSNEQADGGSSASVIDDSNGDTSHVSILSNPSRTSKRISGRRSRLSVSTSPIHRGPGDEEGDETYIEENVSPEPITPAPRRRGGPSKKQKNVPQVHAGVEREQRITKSSFPIQTHRMVNVEALPTIMEEGEEDGGHPEEESFRVSATFSDRSQPNAVDVLAQICREAIQSSLDKLDTTSGASSSRAELRRKRTALEAFASDLDQRLFDMSEAVESRLTLEVRVRKSKRELAELQARWIQVRRQRDETALRADAIRRQNWENEKEGRRQWEISELARSTELNLTGEVSEQDNLEFVLKEVASKVSSAHGRVGMLDKVRSLNGQLERLAAVLERQ